MEKKILAMLLAICLLAGLMCGCSGLLGSSEEEVVYENLDSYYQFWDYEGSTYVRSEIGTYQAVTGQECQMSSYDWSFLQEDYSNMIEGYDEYYGVFLYEYNRTQLNKYIDYIKTQGFYLWQTEDYQEGTSSYYYNEDTGFYFDIFVANSNEYIVIEPYLNADPA